MEMSLLLVLLGSVSSISSAMSVSELGYAESGGQCDPNYGFISRDEACSACHDCRTGNNCPCAFFNHTVTGSDALTHYFCYDDKFGMAESDKHNTAMHCSTLAGGASVQLCEGNAAEPSLLQRAASLTETDKSHSYYAWSPVEDAKCWQEPRRSSIRGRRSTGGSGMSGSMGNSMLQMGRRHSSNAAWNVETDLIGQYDNIFAPSGNRNAASHLWANHILGIHEGQLSHAEIQEAFAWFCPVSGSPLGSPSEAQPYKQTNLEKAGGGEATGYVYHCCWPCACDTKDFLRIDTKTITDKHGAEKTYNFFVIGDPCANSPERCAAEGDSGCLPLEAPAVVCNGNTLKNFIASDKGHVIVGMFHSSPLSDQTGSIDYETAGDTEGGTLSGACDARRSNPQSGMGTIFKEVALLNPL